MQLGAEIPWSEMIQEPRVIPHHLADDGTIPNNKLPLLVYQGIINLPGEDPAQALEDLFLRNGWVDAWRDGVYSYHHYHSTAHEVLAIFCGSALIQFGGEHGIELDVEPGDVILIPAGVAHKKIRSTTEFAVVGAYPRGQKPDLLTDKPGERAKAEQNIARVPLPESDPILGSDGYLQQYWSASKFTGLYRPSR
jgi:uncharacterized protein YjlB